MSAATSLEAAQWLMKDFVTWWDLVRYGPPVFEVYVRVAQNPELSGSGPGGGEDSGLRLALGVLGAHTATPTDAYAAIWEGWIAKTPLPVAPRVHIPNRTMLLFAGPVALMRDAPSSAWQMSGRSYQEPHLVWPEDQAWCVACEVDEEIEFSVGCSNDAAEAIIDAIPGAVRRVAYGDAAPLYRDPD